MSDLRRLIVLASILLTLTLQPLSMMLGPQPVYGAPSITSIMTREKYTIVGQTVNLTATASGGALPYTYNWDFGDGDVSSGPSSWVLHRYVQAGDFTVTVEVIDAMSSSVTATMVVRVLPWPIVRDGWEIRWNITDSDGINIWDVRYNGKLVIRDARLAGIMVNYRYNYCHFYDEFLRGFLGRTEAWLFYDNSSNPITDPYFQLRANYRVPGYNYTQIWRFYPNGDIDAEMVDRRGGCSVEHSYEARWRVDMAIDNDQNDLMSVYTQDGMWRNLVWEGVYNDNGLRDPSHDNAQWRVGDGGTHYYLTPKVERSQADFPDIPSKILLVRAKPNEIEKRVNILNEDPTVWVNPGELAYRRDIAFWFVSNFWEYGSSPLPIVPTVMTLSFHLESSG